MDMPTRIIPVGLAGNKRLRSPQALARWGCLADLDRRLNVDRVADPDPAGHDDTGIDTSQVQGPPNRRVHEPKRRGAEAVGELLTARMGRDCYLDDGRRTRSRVPAGALRSLRSKSTCSWSPASAAPALSPPIRRENRALISVSCRSGSG